MHAVGIEQIGHNASSAQGGRRMIATQTVDLSILIVNWNGIEMLRALLGSIEANRGNLNVETIIIDNASSDGSPEMVTQEFPQVQLIRNPNNDRFGRANNHAAAMATAPLLLLLNNDTLVRPGALETMVQFLDEHPDIIACGPKLIGRKGTPQSSVRNLPCLKALLHPLPLLKWTRLFRQPYRQYRHEGFDPRRCGPAQQLDAAALMIRRDAFNRCRGFDEEYEFGVEDVDLCIRLGELGTLFYLPAAEVEHLGRISSHANRTRVNRAYLCGWARYFGKHHGRGTALLYKLAITLDLPARFIVLWIEWIAQKIAGRTERAKLTSERLRAARSFAFTGLPRFWAS